MDAPRPGGIGLRITSDPDTTQVSQPSSAAKRREGPDPLRLLWVADLTPGHRRTWNGPSLRRRVDAHTYSEALADWAPTLRLDVPNHLSAEPKSLELDLRFTSLDDFTPAGVARQVPALRRLLAIRTQIEAVRDRGLEREPFRAALGEAGVDQTAADGLYDALVPAPKPPPSRPAPRDDDARIGRLLDMVDTGEAPAPGFAEAIGHAVSEPGVSRAAADGLLADFDAKLGGQVRALLAAPAFRALEAAWRGLKLLVDRLPFRDGVALDVLPAGREALADALYYQVLLPEHEGEEDAPLAAVFIDSAFGHDAADVALLDDLAGSAASLQTPLVASLSPGFFGFEGPERVGPLPLVSQMVEAPEYIAWNKLRGREEARFLALAFPPFLLRPAYGPEHPARGFSVAEADTSGVWAGGAVAVALAIAQSYSATGWPTHLAGQTVEDLPLHATPRGRTPLATLLPEDKAAELADAGFVVLGGAPDRDRLRVLHAANVWKPARYDDAERTAHAEAHATLGCSLFTARVAHRLFRLSGELDAAAPMEEKQASAEEAMRRFLGAPGADVPAGAVTTEPVDGQETEGYDLLAVRLDPPAHVLDRPVHLAVGLPVPRAV